MVRFANPKRFARFVVIVVVQTLIGVIGLQPSIRLPLRRVTRLIPVGAIVKFARLLSIAAILALLFPTTAHFLDSGYIILWSNQHLVQLSKQYVGQKEKGSV